MTVDEYVITEVPAEDRAKGTLRSELGWHAARARRVLLDLVARSGDLGPYLEMLRSATADHGERMKLVIPAEIAAALERGDWSWVHAKDGSGILPTVMDADGKFAKQVRLVSEEIPRDPAEIANAAAHAQTQAMLRQIMAKLDVMDKKLDLLLAGQTDAWVGQIIGGVRMFQAVVAEPGDKNTAGALMANAVQSLEEGRSRGLRALQSATRAKPSAPGILELGTPSKTRADWLDARQEEITWIYGASRTVASIHSAEGRPGAARMTMTQLGADLMAMRAQWEEVLRYSAYWPEREAFWRDQVPALYATAAVEREPLILATSAEELSELWEGYRRERLPSGERATLIDARERTE